MSTPLGDTLPHSVPPLSITQTYRRSFHDTSDDVELGLRQSSHNRYRDHVDEPVASGRNSAASSPESSHLPQMKRTTRSSAKLEAEPANGNHPTTMPFPKEHRRRYSAVDGSTASNLMGMQGMNLEDQPTTPKSPGMRDEGTGFLELPAQDRKNFLLLVLLYFLQGIPMGLATGSVPFLLKKHLSYGQIGVFSLASYPYSLKLLWSPIVDAVWSPRIGRRKSWILPVQAFSGVSMLWLGSKIDDMMVAAGANGGAGVWNFTMWWFFLVFTCATQDIAVDGKRAGRLY